MLFTCVTLHAKSKGLSIDVPYYLTIKQIPIDVSLYFSYTLIIGI
jgi:lipopolysaccharide assembly outer membrane protein LptD (OstA)